MSSKVCTEYLLLSFVKRGQDCMDFCDSWGNVVVIFFHASSLKLQKETYMDLPSWYKI